MIPAPDFRPLVAAIAKEVGLACPSCGRAHSLPVADYMIRLRRMLKTMEQIMGPDPGRKASGAAAALSRRRRNKDGRVAEGNGGDSAAPLSFAAMIYPAIGRGKSQTCEDLRIARRVPEEHMAEFSGKKMTRGEFLKALIAKANRRPKLNAETLEDEE